MIIGNCKDESTLFSRQTPDLFTLDMAGLRERIVQAGVPASAVDELLAFYQRDYPSDSPSDIYFRISTDRGARMNAISQAERKVAQGNGAVYMTTSPGIRRSPTAKWPSKRSTRPNYRWRCG